MAQDGIYNFRDCIPDGAIDIANIAPGDVVSRAWSFRVNGRFDLQQALNSGADFDARHIARGYDGLLYMFGESAPLAQINTWQAQYNPTVSDYQAAGMRQTWGIPMSFTLTLTFTETIFSDRLLEILAQSIPYGFQNFADPSFNFQGRIRGRA